MQGFTGKEDEGFKSSGGGENFRRFLAQELVPYIDKEFSTSSYRIYCGYSFTGLSVIDELLDEDTVFDALLMIDPSWWWDDYVMEKRANATLAGRKFNRKQLFIAASGEAYPEKYFIKARDISSLSDIVRRTKPVGLEWKFERYADESHHSMALRALYDGSLISFAVISPRCTSCRRPEKLRSRYETLSARLGERISLSEDLLTFFGGQFLSNFKEPEQAIRYFEMAADAYPGSQAAWQGLAEASMAKGDKSRAENARKVLESLRAN